MKNNEELQRDVQNAIKWEPSMHAAEIGVTAKDGVITLSGKVDSYSKKVNAERAAKNVLGVKAVAEDITVQYGPSFQKDDTEIATAVLNAWKYNFEVPEDKIKVKVENGWVTLEGELSWDYQRKSAKNAINKLSGVKGVTNNIKIKSEIHDAIEQKDVQNALRRSSVDDSDINVVVSGTTVILEGTVPSWHEKEEAKRIAWNTPGIWNVKNELEVDYSYAYEYD